MSGSFGINQATICLSVCLSHLDISVNDAPLVAGQDGVDNLTEEVAREIFREEDLAVDEVEEIFTRLRTFQDQDERIWTLVEI